MLQLLLVTCAIHFTHVLTSVCFISQFVLPRNKQILLVLHAPIRYRFYLTHDCFSLRMFVHFIQIFLHLTFKCLSHFIHFCLMFFRARRSDIVHTSAFVFFSVLVIVFVSVLVFVFVYVFVFVFVSVLVFVFVCAFVHTSSSSRFEWFPTFDDEIYVSHLLLMISRVLKLPAKISQFHLNGPVWSF